MNGQGVRPNKLWHWAAIAFLVATFLAEPRASMALTWQLFRGAGAIGGELLTGEPEPDVLNLQPDPTQPNPDQPGQLDQEPHSPSEDSAPPTRPHDDGDGESFRVDGNGIRSVLDHGVDGVLALHAQVRDIQTAGGFTLEVGDQPDGGRS